MSIADLLRYRAILHKPTLRPLQQQPQKKKAKR